MKERFARGKKKKKSALKTTGACTTEPECAALIQTIYNRTLPPASTVTGVSCAKIDLGTKKKEFENEVAFPPGIANTAEAAFEFLMGEDLAADCPTSAPIKSLLDRQITVMGPQSLVASDTNAAASGLSYSGYNGHILVCRTDTYGCYPSS